MKLVDLLKLANEGYPDGALAWYFDANTGAEKESEHGDSLAEFVVRELRDDFQARDTDAEQLDRAYAALDHAIKDLEGVLDALCGAIRMPGDDAARRQGATSPNETSA